MTENSESAAQAIDVAPADNGRFDQVSIALHWLTVILIVVQFGTVWTIEAIDEKSSLAAALLSLHRTSGVATWIIAVARLVWRHNFAYLPPFPASMPKIQQLIAKANEYGLYLLLLVQPITGLGRVLLRGEPFSLLFWEVPALLAPNHDLRLLLVQAHGIGANALVILIGLHAGAALFHRLVLRDSVLQRMLPSMQARAKLAPKLAKGEAE